MINKFDSFDIKSIPYTKNSDTSMLIDEAYNLNLDDGSIDMKFDVENCRPLIPSTDSINLNNDQHTSKGSIINEKQHEAFLQALVSYQNSKIQDLLENHFIHHDTFKRTMNGSSQQKFRKLYSTPKTSFQDETEQVISNSNDYLNPCKKRKRCEIKVQPIPIGC